MICGRNDPDLGEVVKCSMGVCGKFYHPECVLANPVTNVLQGTWIPVGSVDGDKKGMRFRCPQHYCRTCGLSGANIYSVSCIRCPYAYHSRYMRIVDRRKDGQEDSLFFRIIGCRTLSMFVWLGLVALNSASANMCAGAVPLDAAGCPRNWFYVLSMIQNNRPFLWKPGSCLELYEI